MSPRTTERPDAMDPRIARRRADIEETRRRGRRRITLIIAIAVTVLALAWYVTRTPLFDVDSIVVTGNSIVTTDEVLDASGIRIGEPLLEIDPSASSRAIEDLPWIATASVDRRWGGEISIVVTERLEVAVALTADGTRMLVDVDGRVLAPDGPWDRTDLLLEGVEAGEPGTFVEGAEQALAAVGMMGPGVRSRVTSITVADDGSVTLGLRPQGTVVLGPPTRLEAKIASLQIVLGQVDQRDLGSINLIDPETPVVVRAAR